MGNKIGFPRYILDPVQLDGDYTGVSNFSITYNVAFCFYDSWRCPSSL